MFRPASAGFLLGLLLSLCACVSPPPAPAFSPAESALVAAMAQRLALSREVAWIKYRDALPVLDPAREAAVLKAVTERARARGLDAATGERFFAAQIAASRAEQEDGIFRWSRGAPLPTYAPRDLRADLRRDIDRVNDDLLAALAALAALGQPPGIPSAARRERVRPALREAGFSPRAAALAASPL